MGRDKTVGGRHLDRSEGNEKGRLERNALENLVAAACIGTGHEIGLGM